MSFDVTVAGKSLPTDASALKSFRADLNLAFHLEEALTALLETPVGRVPASASKTSVTYDGPAASWSPGGGPVQFGLQGGASGALEIVNTGALISYTDGLDSPQQKSIAVPPNVAYLKVTLNFNISANASASYSGGSYGVTAALDASAAYAISFCKAFSPDTLLGAAIGQAFQSFVLPLHKDTLAQMSDGDFLLHEFDGNLHLSFGAYAGLDQVLYAGQSSVDVLKTFGSPLATLSGGVQPEIKANVSLDFAFQYATKFEALFSKASGMARLHLFRSQTATTAATLKAGLTFDGNVTASITSNAQTVGDSIVKAAGGASALGGQAIKSVVGAASGEVGKYVNEVNDKLTSWLNRANGIQANLQAAIETSNARTVLAGYDFDLSSTNFAAAWQAAIDGDFVKALQTGAVTLGVGSGLERAYQAKTTFSCNFFNLWKFTSWQQFSSNVSFVYAGNNVFHFVAKVGRTTETESMGAMHSMDFYFSATADSSGSNASNITADLHIDLTAQKDRKAADRIATLLDKIGGGLACGKLAAGMHAFAANSPNGTAQLQVTIPAAAYRRVQCDPYAGGKPQTGSTVNDSQNWKAFAQAADDLSAWPLKDLSTLNDQQLAFFKSFNAWVSLNEAANGSIKLNRVDLGNPFNNWPPSFPASTDTSSRLFIVASMMAGQSFMNFCADLRALADTADVNSAGTTWEGLLAMITKAIRSDLNVDFLRPAALATIRLCRAPGGTFSTISGPSAATRPVDHFAVSITL
jgi:hypothetical protein